MIILVDMDGVIADFDKGFLLSWAKKYPHRPKIAIRDRKNQDIRDDYPIEMSDEVKKIYTGKNFYKNLPVIPNAKSALQEMAKMGLDVFICTSPLTIYKNCILEKYQWVEKNIGKEWVKKIVMTKDKTLIHADILIDDRTNIKGIRKPHWKHVLFDAPYNQTYQSKYRINWNNWKQILD